MTAETVEVEAFSAAPGWWPTEPSGRAVGPLVPYCAEMDDARSASRLLRYNASSHDEHGYITKDPDILAALGERLASKLDGHADELTLVAADLDPAARTLLIGYGVTARSVREAARQARAEGHAVSSLIIYSLWPVPEEAIRAAAEGVQRVVVAELNHGQYRREVERVLCGRVEVAGVHRVDGLLIPPAAIMEALG